MADGKSERTECFCEKEESEVNQYVKHNVVSAYPYLHFRQLPNLKLYAALR